MRSTPINNVRAKHGLVAILSALVSLLPLLASADEHRGNQPLFTLDENVWATFYDLPSRRFRSIRDAFIRRDFEAAEHDLQVSTGFLSVEVGRSVAPLNAPLSEVIDQLDKIRADIRSQSVTTSDFDAAFARAHWLLAQHFLVLALQARDAKQHVNAGRYLWATAHHLERAVLWSDARIDRSLVNALDATREMGTRLQSSKNPERVYRDKPIATTAKVLIRIGDHLSRKVWISESIKP